MLDVDSKDPTVGISSPPKVFVQPEFLTKLASCVDNSGKQILPDTNSKVLPCVSGTPTLLDDYLQVTFEVRSISKAVGSLLKLASKPQLQLLKLYSYCISGLFVLNLACRDPKLRLEVLKNIRAEFPFVLSYKVPDEVNEVLFCSRQKSQIHLQVMIMMSLSLCLMLS